MIHFLSPLPIAGACIAVSGIGFAGWLCYRRLEQHDRERFHDLLLNQVARWLSEQWGASEGTLIRALKKTERRGTPCPSSLENLLRIEFEATMDGWDECELLVHIAIWNDGVIKLGTLRSRCELELLPGYVRRRLLTRYDQPAMYVLWTQNQQFEITPKPSQGVRT